MPRRLSPIWAAISLFFVFIAVAISICVIDTATATPWVAGEREFRVLLSIGLEDDGRAAVSVVGGSLFFSFSRQSMMWPSEAWGETSFVGEGWEWIDFGWLHRPRNVGAPIPIVLKPTTMIRVPSLLVVLVLLALAAWCVKRPRSRSG